MVTLLLLMMSAYILLWRWRSYVIVKRNKLLCKYQPQILTSLFSPISFQAFRISVLKFLGGHLKCCLSNCTQNHWLLIDCLLTDTPIKSSQCWFMLYLIFQQLIRNVICLVTNELVGTNIRFFQSRPFPFLPWPLSWQHQTTRWSQRLPTSAALCCF